MKTVKIITGILLLVSGIISAGVCGDAIERCMTEDAIVGGVMGVLLLFLAVYMFWHSATD